MPGLALDARVLARAYDYLRATRPFCRWLLPESDALVFHVARSRHWQGQCYAIGARYGIDISEALVGQSPTLLAVMAHEMVHLAQKVARTETKAAHNAEFRRLAAQVCRAHGFDHKIF
jgi:hypothetical protein